MAFWAGFGHWSPPGLGQGPGPSVPEFPGGEQGGAGLCRDCLEQAGSTRGRAGAGSIHVSLLPFPEVPTAAQAAPGVLGPFQPSLRRRGECAGAGDLCPHDPCAVGLELGFSSALNVQLWLPGHRGHDWMADGGCSVPILLLQCCWKGHLELSWLWGGLHLPGLMPPHAWVPPCPSPGHSHHPESPGVSQCSSQGKTEPSPRELRGPGRAGAGLALGRSCHTCPLSLSPSTGSIVSLHVCDALPSRRLGFEVEIKH